jgi:hypothetical protein
MNPEETSIAAVNTVVECASIRFLHESAPTSNGGTSHERGPKEHALAWLGRRRHHPQLGMVFTERLVDTYVVREGSLELPSLLWPPNQKVAKMRYLVSSPKLQARPLLWSGSVPLNFTP